MTTKILALTDALGNLVRFVLLPGHRFDTVGVPPLIDGVQFGALIADTAFDSNTILADLNERGAKIVIAQRPRRASPLPLDTEMDRWRHLIENFFCKLKEFKRIAMRADKTDTSFTAIIQLAAAVIHSRLISTDPSRPLFRVVSTLTVQESAIGDGRRRPAAREGEACSISLSAMVGSSIQVPASIGTSISGSATVAWRPWSRICRSRMLDTWSMRAAASSRRG